jgi:hypothetical protein
MSSSLLKTVPSSEYGDQKESPGLANPPSLFIPASWPSGTHDRRLTSLSVAAERGSVNHPLFQESERRPGHRVCGALSIYLGCGGVAGPATVVQLLDVAELRRGLAEMGWDW